MNLLDVNVLIYSFRRDADRHEAFRAWMLELVNGDTAFAISEQVMTRVIRITTHPKIFKEPTRLKDAIAFTEKIQQHPNCRVVRSSTQHWSLFVRLCQATNARANLVTDAWFAALALESGCTWITTDRDFARFPGLKWQHPLDHSNTIENPK